MGVILVFIPGSLGAFISPELLGGGKTMMVGNLIQAQFGYGPPTGPSAPRSPSCCWRSCWQAALAAPAYVSVGRPEHDGSRGGNVLRRCPAPAWSRWPRRLYLYLPILIDGGC